MVFACVSDRAGAATAGTGARTGRAAVTRAARYDLRLLVSPERRHLESSAADTVAGVLEPGIAGFDEVGELETPLERACGNAAVQIVALVAVIGTLAGNGELVLLGDHLDVFGAEAGDRQRNAIAVLPSLSMSKGG
jgi:hypothetical protein